MTRRRKPHKPTDPAEHAATMLARKREIDEHRARGATVTHDEQGRIINARRPDVFALLHERKALTDPQLIAVRRLETLIATAYGHERPEQSLDRVDRSSQGAPGQNITTAMIDASRDLRTIMREVGFTNARLLNAILDPKIKSDPREWRKTVSDTTGEARHEVQAAMIRSACENLALAFQAFDYGARERKGRAA